MTGRIKFIDSAGDPLQVEDSPAIPYDYEQPSAYDQQCGTSNLNQFQLPNEECPSHFVCDKPDPGPLADFVDCIESMNCAMTAGMTTHVSSGSVLALFNHMVSNTTLV